MRRLIALSFLALSPLAMAVSSDPTIAQAEQFLAQRQPNSAYELLAAQEDERGGNPDFDYVLGQAALESGRASEAAFAFERCLATDPKNGPCRVMMARTHLALGEDNSAKKELEAVKASQPPVEVQNLVAQYLGAIQQREVNEQRRIGAWAQLGLGWDGNVNSARADSNVIFPSLPGMVWTLNPAGVQQKDGFAQGGAGASLQYKLNPAFAFLADAGVNARGYQEWNNFNSLTLDGSVGLSWRTGPNSVLAKLQQQSLELDTDSYRNFTGILLQYQHAMSETAAFSAYVQDSLLDYRKNRPDANRYTAGLGYSGVVGESAVIYTGLYGGAEESDGNAKHLNQDFYGARVGGSIGQGAVRGTGSLSVEQRKFGGPQPLVMTVAQKDTQIDASLGAIWQLNKPMSVRPTYTYTTSSSNNPLSDFDRHTFSVDFRYEL